MIDGLEADVVTLALAYDIDAIAEHGGLIPADWQKRLPHNSAPYTSTIVFLVRKGNPKGIKDWDDLVKPGVEVDHAQPEDLGRRALELPGGLGLRAEAARRRRRQGAASSSTKLYKNVPVLDSGARGSTTTFVERGIGDVLIAWENEAYLALKEFGAGQVRDRRARRVSILAEPPVAVVDKVVDKHGHAQGRRGLPRVPLLARRPGDRGQELLPPARSRQVAAKYADAVPASSSCSPSTRCSAAGPRRRRPTSPTAACSTRSTAS